ncbi:MAG: CopD family protein, partial [Nitrospirota bacterium]
FVTGPSGADVCLPYGRKKCLGDTARLIMFLSVLFALLVNAAHLVFHASVMTETPLGEVFSIIPIFLAKTKYGQFGVIRTGFLVALAVISFIGLFRGTRAATYLGALISLSVLATICMAGHKGAEGYLNAQFALDLLHTLTIAMWIGGLFFILLCFSFLMSEADVELWGTFHGMITRFSDLATYCVALALATGVGLALFSVKSADILVETRYGIVLIVKTLLAVSIFLLGGANKFLLLPAIDKAGEGQWQRLRGLRRRLHTVVRVEALIGLAVLLATSLLTHLSPEG